MRPISIHVSESAYREFKALSKAAGRPVAELIRQAMVEYLAREGGSGRSMLDVPAHPSGRLLEPWTRSDLLEEMAER